MKFPIIKKYHVKCIFIKKKLGICKKEKDKNFEPVIPSYISLDEYKKNGGYKIVNQIRIGEISDRQIIDLLKNISESDINIEFQERSKEKVNHHYSNTLFKKVLNDGIPIFRSANDVILCSGKNGILSPEYFQDVRF